MVLGSQDKWRRHPLIANGHRAAFPGLRNAAIIFAGYVVVEAAYNRAFGPKNTFDVSKLAWEKSEIGVKPEVHDSNEYHHDHGHGHGISYGRKKYEKTEIGVKPTLLQPDSSH